MATPKIIADFETQLATALAIGGTSFTLSSATDDDGVALPNGKYYFTIDNGTSQKEYVVGTVAGTSVTSVSNVTRQGVESSGVDRAHRVGASVIMTDFMTYKNYIDETTTAGAPDADANTKGVVEVPTSAEIDADTATGATGASLAVSPDQLVLSKYGTRLPSATEKLALEGGGALGTPSGTNKYLTQEGGAVTIEEFTASGTWTKPDNTKAVEVIVIGAGGGGGNGASASNAIALGGSGGGGGGLSKAIFDGADLAATVAVTVGTGGGAAAAGGFSSFGDLLKAFGGSAGVSGSVASGGSGGAGNVADGGAGGASISAAAGATAASTTQAPTGGGGGGQASGAGTAGGAGGAITLLDIKAAGTSGAAATNAGNGVAATVTGACGTGGGGGGGSASTGTTNGGDGGSGAIPGGGGGGGGAYDSDASGGSAGSAGIGARGVVYVISYS